MPEYHVQSEYTETALAVNNKEEQIFETAEEANNLHAGALQSGEGESGVGATLGLNGQIFLFQLFNFALVVAIVWFLILKPLTKKIEERKKIIDESLDKAKEIDSEYQRSQLKYQEKIDEAKTEANKIIQLAHDEGVVLETKMKEKAKQEIEKLVAQAKRNLEIDRQEMENKLKKETVELTIAVVEKIIGEKLDKNKDEKFISEILKTV